MVKKYSIELKEIYDGFLAVKISVNGVGQHTPDKIDGAYKELKTLLDADEMGHENGW